MDCVSAGLPGASVLPCPNALPNPDSKRVAKQMNLVMFCGSFNTFRVGASVRALLSKQNEVLHGNKIRAVKLGRSLHSLSFGFRNYFASGKWHRNPAFRKVGESPL